jgi:hypothetical protein
LNETVILNLQRWACTKRLSVLLRRVALGRAILLRSLLGVRLLGVAAILLRSLRVPLHRAA